MSRARNEVLIAKFGTTLAKTRRDAGVTQEQLADLAEIDRTFVGLLESGRRQPTLSVLFALARGLEMSAEELLFRMNQF